MGNPNLLDDCPLRIKRHDLQHATKGVEEHLLAIVSTLITRPNILLDELAGFGEELLTIIKRTPPRMKNDSVASRRL